MPPCGYRAEAISGIEQFLADNLRYFRELYRPRGLTPLEAIEVERKEIAAIRNGERGGSWAAAVVVINESFYDALAALAPREWSDVERAGRVLITEIVSELASLSHGGRHAA